MNPDDGSVAVDDGTTLPALTDDPSLDTPGPEVIFADANDDPTAVGKQSWVDDALKIIGPLGGTINNILNSQRYGAPYGQARPGLTYGRGSRGGTLSFGQGGTGVILLLVVLALLFGGKLFKS